VNPNLGAPIGPDIPDGRDVQVFDHIPDLYELLPNGGWPGVVYAQVCIHNLKAAADRTERPDHLRPIRGSSYYSIVGPRGRSDMALVGRGKPIAGAAPEAGARLFFTDGEVQLETGLQVDSPIFFRRLRKEDIPDGEIPVTQEREEPRVQGRSVGRKAVGEDREGEAGGPEPDKQASGGEGSGNPPRPKKLLSGHNHPSNFGRIVEGCTGCERVLARRTKQQLHGQMGRGPRA